MQRMGLCIGLKPEAVARYRELHAAVWPDVLAAISKANIRNYSIFLREPENMLFAYWEYHGSDFAADAALMAEAPAMREWWTICDPLQEPLQTRAADEWWARMVEVFHHDQQGLPSALTAVVALAWQATLKPTFNFHGESCTATSGQVPAALVLKVSSTLAKVETVRRNRIIVSGRRNGERRDVVFAREPGCPVIRIR